MHILSFHGIVIDGLDRWLIDVAAIMSFTEPFEIISDQVYFFQAISFYLGLVVSRHKTFGMCSCFGHMI